MEIQQLVYLVAIADESSFSKAADRLGVAQPSLSQQIRKLEHEIGVPLFDRLPRKVVPTQAGERLLHHARRVLNELADAKRELTDSSTQVSGPLSVGAIPTIAPYVLPDLMHAFTALYPEVELDVTEEVTSRLIQMLEQGELDLAILSSHEGSPTVHVERVALEPLRLLLPARHALAQESSVALSQISQDRFLVLHEMHCLSGQVAEVCHHRRVRADVLMRGAQLSTIAEMVSAGMGVSVVPEMMARRDKDDSRVYLPFKGEQPEREICLAWSLLRYRTQASKALERLVRQQLVEIGSTGRGRGDFDA